LRLQLIGFSLIVEIANKHASESGSAPTSSAILGPFYSPDAPFRELGGSIIDSPHKGVATLMHGKVLDMETKKGIPNAIVDIWEASSNGKYDFQDPENQTPNNLRGKFRTNGEGNYNFYCLKPTGYSLPRDGKYTALPL
jgi:protocatechuate 3,4-dioxygenase beta subunit